MTPLHRILSILAVSTFLGGCAAATDFTPEQTEETRSALSSGTWSTVISAPFPTGTMLLLTDGRLLVNDGSTSPNWWTLTPDSRGFYSTGTWTQVASMSKGRTFYCSAVLRDGRVMVFGGEYTNVSGDSEDSTGEIYNPVANTWTPMSSPSGALTGEFFGDMPCIMLASGKLLAGATFARDTATWDPTTNTWSAAGTKFWPTGSAEESWTLLPGGSVLTVDTDFSGDPEIWNSGVWSGTLAGSLGVDLAAGPPGFIPEIGPSLLLNDGRVIYFGATGQTALYTPGPLPKAGSWVVGPFLPLDANGNQNLANDDPAVLLPNGHVLLSATGGFFDVDPTVTPIAFTSVASPNIGDGNVESGRFMMLPTGEAVYAENSNQLAFFNRVSTVSGSTVNIPTITSSPAQAARGSTFQLTGTKLNGVSQTVAYGDDATQASNYPLVAVTNGTAQTYTFARTHDHSTMGVATGTTHVTTQVTLPGNLLAGQYDMFAIANGVQSAGFGTAIAITCEAGAAVTNDLVCNPGFEDVVADWTLAGSARLATTAHSGSHSITVGSPATGAPGAVSQQVIVRSGATTTLTFWTRDSCSGIIASGPVVNVFDVTGTTLLGSQRFACTSSSTWAEQTFDLSPFGGQVVTLAFSQVRNGTAHASFDLDDVDVTTSP